MSSWTLKTLGASQATGTITGAANTVSAAASDAIDALAVALVHHAELGQRSYTTTVDDQLVLADLDAFARHSVADHRVAG